MSKKLKVLVGVKRVIDFAVKIRIKNDLSGVMKEGVKMSMNPFDEIAVEEAVRMKEKGIVGEVVSVTIGPKESQETLRTALALGADRSIHIPSNEELEPLVVAKLLEKVVEKEKPDIILLGKQAIDDDYSQTPQILSGLLDYQMATFANKIEVAEDRSRALVTREIDGGLETLDVKLPAVISCDLRLNTPRFANLPSIMKARKKPIETIEISSLGVDTKNRLEIKKVTEPPVRQQGTILQSVEELVEKLKKHGFA